MLMNLYFKDLNKKFSEYSMDRKFWEFVLKKLCLRPGKSFGLKFIPNQSDLFRNLFPRQSELIRVNPKKVFNLV